jgi:hypothetical protein
MYASFSLQVNDDYFQRDTHTEVLLERTASKRTVEQKQETDAATSLKYINTKLAPNASVTAGDIINYWFPAQASDVFISHSHGDIELATALAIWLKKHFDLASFIDSAVWGHARDLLREVDNEHCRNEDGRTYNYDRRNGTTSHVYLMLANALTSMIDSCECLIFLNTPKSLSAKQAATNAATYSPWIFTELSVAEVIQRRSPDYHRRAKTAAASEGRIASERRDFTPIYDISKQLRHTKQSDLDRWRRSKTYSRTGKHSLDLLYGLFPDKETK